MNFSQKSQQDERLNCSVGGFQDTARHIMPLMDLNLSQKFQQDSMQKNIFQPKASKLLLNEEGLKLLQETTEAVRGAINKVNIFKQFLNQQTGKSIFNNVETFPSGINVNQLNAPSLNSSVFNTQNDCNLQVFFTIPDNKITESEVREVFEKEGFEDFVITIKNRMNHSFGFVKFSKEDAVTRAIEFNLKMSVNGHLIKIRAHKPNYIAPISNTNDEATSNVSQEIDEGLLINISSGYQNKRTLIDNYEPVGRNDEEENSDLPDSIQPQNSFYHSTEPQLSDSSKLILTDSVMKNMNDNSVQPTENNFNQSQNEMDYDPNEYLENTFPTNSTPQSSKKRSPFFRGRGRGKKFNSHGFSRGGKKGFSPRYFNNHNDKKAEKNKSKKMFNSNQSNNGNYKDYNVP